MLETKRWHSLLSFNATQKTIRINNFEWFFYMYFSYTGVCVSEWECTYVYIHVFLYTYRHIHEYVCTELKYICFTKSVLFSTCYSGTCFLSLKTTSSSSFQGRSHTVFLILFGHYVVFYYVAGSSFIWLFLYWGKNNDFFHQYTRRALEISVFPRIGTCVSLQTKHCFPESLLLQ